MNKILGQAIYQESYARYTSTFYFLYIYLSVRVFKTPFIPAFYMFFWFTRIEGKSLHFRLNHS